MEIWTMVLIEMRILMMTVNFLLVEKTMMTMVSLMMMMMTKVMKKLDQEKMFRTSQDIELIRFNNRILSRRVVKMEGCFHQ